MRITRALESEHLLMKASKKRTIPHKGELFWVAERIQREKMDMGRSNSVRAGHHLFLFERNGRFLHTSM